MLDLHYKTPDIADIISVFMVLLFKFSKYEVKRTITDESQWTENGKIVENAKATGEQRGRGQIYVEK